MLIKNIIDIESLITLEITGININKFLQGQITKNIDNLNESKYILTPICNINGKVIALVRIFTYNNKIFIIVNKDLKKQLIEHLQKYGIFNKINLQEVKDFKWYLYSYYSYANLKYYDEYQNYLSITIKNNSIYLKEVYSSNLKYQLIGISKNNISNFIIHNNPEEYLFALSINGIFIPNSKNNNNFLPQILGYDKLNLIDYNKGCYLGQEKISLQKHKGKINRILSRILIYGNNSNIDPNKLLNHNIIDNTNYEVGKIIQIAKNKTKKNEFIILALLKLKYNPPLKIKLFKPISLKTLKEV